MLDDVDEISGLLDLHLGHARAGLCMRRRMPVGTTEVRLRYKKKKALRSGAFYKHGCFHILCNK